MLKISPLLANQREPIEHWFNSQWRAIAPPFYASVDLRHAGVKLAPIDTNLFPAGFNNIGPEFLPLCIQATKVEVAKICPTARGALLVPENHTRNLFYLENVAALRDVLAAAGLDVRIGSLLPDLTEPRTIELPSGRHLVLQPLVRRGNRVGVADFDPCFVLLNNDLSGGRPAVLEQIEQPMLPPLALGWSNRLKSQHFAHYQRVAREFSELLDIDPWLIDPVFRNCGEIDFEKRAGEECLSANVDAVLNEVRRKYQEYGIEREPFVMVKADAGTYGMGVMAVKSPDDVRELNRKERNKMARTKEGRSVTQVLVQEGVYTDDGCGNPPVTAEPVIYMIGPRVVGGFWRIHTERGPTDNLNAPGMQFAPFGESMCEKGASEVAERGASVASAFIDAKGTGASPSDLDRFYAYGVVGRLALLAAARELQDVS
jgi:glutamate--cysteine ligase